MREITIYLPDLASNKTHLCDNDGKHDLLGQILYTLGETVIPKQKLPSDLLKSIPPFTCSCRGKIVDTALTIQLASLARLSPREQVERANSALKLHNIILIPVSDKDLLNNETELANAYSNIDEESNPPNLSLTNLARTSTYRCPECLNLMAITELEWIDNEYQCTFCNDVLSQEDQETIAKTFVFGKVKS